MATHRHAPIPSPRIAPGTVPGHPEHPDSPCRLARAGPAASGSPALSAVPPCRLSCRRDRRSSPRGSTCPRYEERRRGAFLAPSRRSRIPWQPRRDPPGNRWSLPLTLLLPRAPEPPVEVARSAPSPPAARPGEARPADRCASQWFREGAASRAPAGAGPPNLLPARHGGRHRSPSATAPALEAPGLQRLGGASRNHVVRGASGPVQALRLRVAVVSRRARAAIEAGPGHRVLRGDAPACGGEARWMLPEVRLGPAPSLSDGHTTCTPTVGRCRDCRVTRAQRPRRLQRLFCRHGEQTASSVTCPWAQARGSGPGSCPIGGGAAVRASGSQRFLGGRTGHSEAPAGVGTRRSSRGAAGPPARVGVAQGGAGVARG